MSELVFSDLTNALVPILTSVIQASEHSKWEWRHDWLQQVNAYRHYPAYNMLVVKLKKCNSPQFYEAYIERRRCPQIKEAFDKHSGLYPPAVLVKVFAHNISAEAWMRENRQVVA